MGLPPLLLYFWYLEQSLHQVVPLELLEINLYRGQGTDRREVVEDYHLKHMVAVLHAVEALRLLKLLTVPQDRAVLSLQPLVRRYPVSEATSIPDRTL